MRFFNDIKKYFWGADGISASPELIRQPDVARDFRQWMEKETNMLPRNNASSIQGLYAIPQKLVFIFFSLLALISSSLSLMTNIDFFSGYSMLSLGIVFGICSFIAISVLNINLSGPFAANCVTQCTPSYKAIVRKIEYLPKSVIFLFNFCVFLCAGAVNALVMSQYVDLTSLLDKFFVFCAFLIPYTTNVNSTCQVLREFYITPSLQYLYEKISGNRQSSLQRRYYLNLLTAKIDKELKCLDRLSSVGFNRRYWGSISEYNTEQWIQFVFADGFSERELGFNNDDSQNKVCWHWVKKTGWLLLGVGAYIAAAIALLPYLDGGRAAFLTFSNYLFTQYAISLPEIAGDKIFKLFCGIYGLGCYLCNAPINMVALRTRLQGLIASTGNFFNFLKRPIYCTKVRFSLSCSMLVVVLLAAAVAASNVIQSMITEGDSSIKSLVIVGFGALTAFCLLFNPLLDTARFVIRLCSGKTNKQATYDALQKLGHELKNLNTACLQSIYERCYCVGVQQSIELSELNHDEGSITDQSQSDQSELDQLELNPPIGREGCDDKQYRGIRWQFVSLLPVQKIKNPVHYNSDCNGLDKGTESGYTSELNL